MLVRTDSAAFLNTILDRWLPMRGYRFYWPARYRAACSVAHGLHGWHLSYFFNTSLIVKKHMTYNHNDDPMIQALLRMSTSERSALLEHRVSHCIDPVDRHQKVDPNKRKHNITFEESPIDGRLPPIPGWPEHPLAPQTRPGIPDWPWHARFLSSMPDWPRHSGAALAPQIGHGTLDWAWQPGLTWHPGLPLAFETGPGTPDWPRHPRLAIAPLTDLACKVLWPIEFKPLRQFYTHMSVYTLFQIL